MAKSLHREAAVEFLRRAVDHSGLSAAALAKKAGVAPSTITRPLSDEEGVFTPKLSTLEKIARAAGLELPGAFLSRRPLPPRHAEVPIVGELRTGVWMEDQEDYAYGTPGEDRYVILPVASLGAGFQGFIVGPGAALDVYKEGSVLVTAEIDPNSVEVGDLIVVRRFRDGLTEVSLRHVTSEDGAAAFVGFRQNGAEHAFDPTSEEFSLLGRVVAGYWEGVRGDQFPRREFGE